MIPYGTIVLAVDAGTIGTQIGAQASSDPLTAGLRLTLTTADNAWFYGHMSRIDVVPNQVVRRGEVLGLSGRAGPDHLHLGVEHGDPNDLIGQH
jgi:murein DD-endopeptidase MepM/ murein hydrolase activator NlpD